MDSNYTSKCGKPGDEMNGDTGREKQSHDLNYDEKESDAKDT